MTVLMLNSKLLIFSCFAFIFGTSLLFGQKRLPEVFLQSFRQNQITLNNLEQHKILVVSFWATWCGPCIEELDALNELTENGEASDDFSIIAISIDDNRTIHKVKPFIKAHGWNFELLLDPNQILKRALNIVDIPYTIIIKNQHIIYEHSGYYPGFEHELMEKINLLISSK